MTIRLSFSGSADGNSYELLVDDLDGTLRETTHISYSSASGAEVSAKYINSDLSIDLESQHADQAEKGTVFLIRFDPELLISRAADVGWTRPIVRFNVVPREDNATSSGPYFALAMPNVVTLPSNQTGFSSVPGDDVKVSIMSIPKLKTLFGIVDDTGVAQITGAPESANRWGVNPATFPAGNGPLISYVHHGVQQQDEMFRQMWLLLAATLAGAGVALHLENFGRNGQKP